MNCHIPSYGIGWQLCAGVGTDPRNSATPKRVPHTAAANDIADTNYVPQINQQR
jgi:hypothetical protein